MHPSRTTECRYGRHASWNVPCNGFDLMDVGFDFNADPALHQPQHSPPPYCLRCGYPHQQGSCTRPPIQWTAPHDPMPPVLRPYNIPDPVPHAGRFNLSDPANWR